VSNSGAFAVAEGGATVAENGGDTVVAWWSFTKTAIAAAALTLVRDGKLDLDALIPPTHSLCANSCNIAPVSQSMARCPSIIAPLLIAPSHGHCRSC
jgi:hypothetical protein